MARDAEFFLSSNEGREGARMGSAKNTGSDKHSGPDGLEESGTRLLRLALVYPPAQSDCCSGGLPLDMLSICSGNSSTIFVMNRTINDSESFSLSGRRVSLYHE